MECGPNCGREPIRKPVEPEPYGGTAAMVQAREQETDIACTHGLTERTNWLLASMASSRSMIDFLSLSSQWGF